MNGKIKNIFILTCLFCYGFLSLAQQQDAESQEVIPPQPCDLALEAMQDYESSAALYLAAVKKAVDNLKSLLDDENMSAKDFKKLKQDVFQESYRLQYRHQTQDQVKAGVEEPEIQNGVFAMYGLPTLENIHLCKDSITPESESEQPVDIELQVETE